MARALLREDQIGDLDNMSEYEHDIEVHKNLVTSGTLNFQDGTISGTGDVYATNFYGDGSDLTGIIPNPLEIGTDDDTVGILTLYGSGSGNDGGKINMYVGADYDTFQNYVVQVTQDDFKIGPSTDPTTFEIRGSNQGLYLKKGTLAVGQDDTQRGSIYIYGHAAGQVLGGSLYLYTSASYDGLADPGDSYSIRVNEANLEIGTTPDPNKMTYNGIDQKWIINGSTNGVELQHANTKVFETVASGIKLNSGGEVRSDGSNVELYYDGNKVLETITDGIKLFAIGSTSLSLYQEANSSVIENETNSGWIYFKGTTAAGSPTNMITADPDAEVRLYHPGTNTLILKSQSKGILVGSSQNISILSESGYSSIYTNTHGNSMRLTGEDTGGTPRILFDGDPDGAAELYHAGDKTFETTATSGINVVNEVTATTYYGDGSNLTGITASGGGISAVVEDTSPELGGDLDTLGYNIVQSVAGDLDIIGYPNGAGVGGTSRIYAGTGSTNGGAAYLSAGAGSANGGAAYIRGGSGSAGYGGDVYLEGGTGTSWGGAIRLRPGVGNFVLVYGSTTTGADMRFYEGTSNGTRHVDLNAPDDITTNRAWILPQDDPSTADGKFLTTDSSGVLSFATALSEVVDDTSPELGGDLILGSYNLKAATGGGKSQLILSESTDTMLESESGVSASAKNLYVRGGASDTGTGGKVYVVGGAGLIGADVYIMGGASSAGSGSYGGDIYFKPGVSFSNSGGNATLEAPAGSTSSPTFDYREAAVSGTHSISLRAPVSVVTDRTWTLPQDDPSTADGKFLTTDASGVLSFVDASVSYPLLAPNGGLTVPSYSFENDTDTGFYLGTAGVMNLTIGSTKVIEYASTQINIQGSARLTLADGQIRASSTLSTATAPAYSFLSDTNTGFFSPSADDVGVSLGGYELFRFEGDGTNATNGVLHLYEAPTNGTNSVSLQAPISVATSRTWTLPQDDPTTASGQFLTTNSSGVLSFADAGGGISDIVEDTTPQLGGDLDTNGNDILFGSDTISGTGDIYAGNLYGDGSNIIGVITTVSGTDHSIMVNLDYASAGHTGFQPAGDYVTDSELTTISGDIVSQIPTDFYTTGEVDTISGVLSAEIDADIATHTALANPHSTTAADIIYDGTETLEAILDDTINGGVLDTITVSNPSGLTINWTAGEIFDHATKAIVNTLSGTDTATNNAVSHLIWTSGTSLSLGTTPADVGSDEVDIADISAQDGAIHSVHQEEILSYRTTSLSDAMSNMFPAIVTEGLVVSEHVEATNALDVEMTAGIYYQDGHSKHTVSALTSSGTLLMRDYKTASAWDSDTNAEIDTAFYNNGSDLVAAGTKWYKSLFILAEDHLHWVYPTVQYNYQVAAMAAPLPPIPPGLAKFPTLMALVYQGGSAALPTGDNWIDVRPTLTTAAAGQITDHGNLTGLTPDDDHPHYLTETRGDARYYTETEINNFDYVNSTTLANTSGTLQTDIDTRLANVVEDTTPQLGGDLDSGAFTISGTGDIYCDDLYTSGDTINVGGGEIKSDGSNVELYDAGDKALATTSGGIDVYSNDDTYPCNVKLEAWDNNRGETESSATTGLMITDGTYSKKGGIFMNSSGDMNVRSFEPGSAMSLQALDTAGSQTQLFRGSPDGISYIAYAGNASIGTTLSGAEIRSQNANPTVITLVTNTIEEVFKIEASATETYFKHGNDDVAIEMVEDGATSIHYAGGKVLETSGDGDAGINVYVDADNMIKMYHSAGVAYIKNHTYGGVLTIRGNQADSTTVTFMRCDPDGSVDLYYDDDEVLTTTSGGIILASYDADDSATIGLRPFDITAHPTRPNPTQGMWVFDTRTPEMRYGIHIHPTTGDVNTRAWNTGSSMSFQGYPTSAPTEHTNMIIANPDGPVSMLYNTVLTFSTSPTGIALGDGTATPAIIGITSDDLYITGKDPDGDVYITAEKTGTGQSTLFKGDPDGAAELYYAGVKIVSTLATGGLKYWSPDNTKTAEIYQSDAGSFTVQAVAGDIQLYEASNPVLIGIRDGAANLYYAGALVGGSFSNIGMYTRASTGLAAVLYFVDSNDLENGYVYSTDGDMAMKTGEVPGKTAGLYGWDGAANDTMVLATQSGSVDLYHAGSLRARTTSTGFHVTVDDFVESYMSFQLGTAGYAQIVLFDPGAYLQLKAMPTGGAPTVVLIHADPDGSTDLYYAGVKKFETSSTGATVTGGLVVDGLTLGDDEIIVFGGGSDGRLLSDGTNFLIKSATETMAMFTPNGAASLYYAGGITLSTHEDGIRLTSQDADTAGSVNLYAFDNTSGPQPSTTTGLWVENDSGDKFGFHLQAADGGVKIRSHTVDAKMTFQGYSTASPTAHVIMLQMDPAGSSDLYYAGGLSIATTSGGMELTGSDAADGNTTAIRAFDQNTHATRPNNTQGLWVFDTATPDMRYGIHVHPTTGDVNTRAWNTGSSMAFQGYRTAAPTVHTNMVLAYPDGGVKLYYDGAEKFDTTNTGATVAGELIAGQVTGLNAPDAAGEAVRTTTNITEVNLLALTGGADTTLHDHDGISENTSARHAASHTVASHSDTSATGSELDTLTDNSIANTLHRHSELVASDGAPDPALSIDSTGKASFPAGTGINEFSIDDTLVGNSDDAVPTEQAVKAYVDNKFYLHTQAVGSTTWTVNHNLGFKYVNVEVIVGDKSVAGTYDEPEITFVSTTQLTCVFAVSTSGYVHCVGGN